MMQQESKLTTATNEQLQAEAKQLRELASENYENTPIHYHLSFLAAALCDAVAVGSAEHTIAVDSIAADQGRKVGDHVGAYWGKPYAHPIAEAIYSVLQGDGFGNWGDYHGDNQNASEFAGQFRKLLANYVKPEQQLDLFVAAAEACECDGVIGYYPALAMRVASALQGMDYCW